MAFHAFYRPKGGLIGVDLFFALSGFLITTLLLEERARHQAIDLRRFWMRRFLRLFPALAAMLAAFAVANIVWETPTTDLRLRSALFGILYISNWTQALQVPAEGLSHLWSIATEEQFYLIWPLFLVVFGSLAFRRPRLFGGLLLVLIVLLSAQRIALWETGTPWQRLYFGPERGLSVIMWGCALAAFRFARGGDPPRHPRVLDGLAIVASVGIAWIVVTLARESSGFLYLGGFDLIGILICVVIASDVAGDGAAPISRLLEVRPLVMLGKISYSLYLWHSPVFGAYRQFVNPEIAFLPGVLKIGLSLIVAIASYRLIELPFLRLKRRFERDRPSRRRATAHDELVPSP